MTQTNPKKGLIEKKSPHIYIFNDKYYLVPQEWNRIDESILHLNSEKKLTF